VWTVTFRGMPARTAYFFTSLQISIRDSARPVRDNNRKAWLCTLASRDAGSADSPGWRRSLSCHRNDPLLVALAETTQVTNVQVHIGGLEARQLAGAHTGGIEQLEQALSLR